MIYRVTIEHQPSDAVRAVVSEVVRHYVAGAIVSGVAAMVSTKDANPRVTLVATVIAAGAGALAGGRRIRAADEPGRRRR